MNKIKEKKQKQFNYLCLLNDLYKLYFVLLALFGAGDGVLLLSCAAASICLNLVIGLVFLATKLNQIKQKTKWRKG